MYSTVIVKHTLLSYPETVIHVECYLAPPCVSFASVMPFHHQLMYHLPGLLAVMTTISIIPSWST